MSGGSIEAISIDGRNFAVAADTDVTRKLGGFENEEQANGDGSSRKIKTRVTWSLTGVSVAISDARGDQEFLQNIADGADNVPISITYVDGSVYQADGSLSGELSSANQSETASFELSGPGKMTKQ